MKISQWLTAMTLPAILLPAATVFADSSGELWEVHGVMTSKAYGNMDMGIHRECRTPDWRDKPEFKIPGSNDDMCKSKTIEHRGNGYAWNFDCGATRGEGKVKMIGQDRMQASMRMDTPQGEFHIDVDSRKTGSCNPDTWEEPE